MSMRLFHLLLIGSSITPVFGQTVTYELGDEVAMLDNAFYEGQAIDGSDVAGRQSLYYDISPDGNTIVFLGVNNSTFSAGVFIVDVGAPDLWRRITIDGAPLSLIRPHWSPDGSQIIQGLKVYDENSGMETFDFDTVDQAIPGSIFSALSVTRKASDNWVMFWYVPDGSHVEYIAIPIFPNGVYDPGRAPVALTNFQFSPVGEGFPGLAGGRISRNGTKIVFSLYTHQTPPDLVPDLSDIYLLDGFDSIVSAPLLPDGVTSSIAVTNLSDSRIIEIRASETDNFVHCMHFSEDLSRIFMCEDFNNVHNDGYFFESLAMGDFDIVLANSDGTGTDFRIVAPFNQGEVKPRPGGPGLFYLRTVCDDMPPPPICQELHLFASTLTVNTTVAGDIIGNPADNAILTSTLQQQSDGSGTVVAIAPGTSIDFPDGMPQVISISGPISPVTEPQLPDDPFVSKIALVREFGPSGTIFSPPIEITISYTDYQVAGLDEPNLALYRLNQSNGVYEIPVPNSDIVNRDLLSNTITFRVDHFSSFALGGIEASALHTSSRVIVTVLFFLVIITGITCGLVRRA